MNGPEKNEFLSEELYWRLRKTMKREAMNAVKISEVTGISLSSLYRKFRGETDFTRSDIEKIANAMGVSPMVFF